MLLFFLCIQPLLKRISQECELEMNCWYADDGLLVGPIDEVANALRILLDVGPSYNFHINPSKTVVFWSTTSQHKLRPLLSVLPLEASPRDGITTLGASIGSKEYMLSFLRSRMSRCNELLTELQRIPDARISFHLHRLSASSCKVQHAFQLTPPDISMSLAKEFDKCQMEFYSSINSVPLTRSSIRQIHLPFRYGGHGFTSLRRTVHASYAASLI